MYTVELSRSWKSRSAALNVAHGKSGHIQMPVYKVDVQEQRISKVDNWVIVEDSEEKSKGM